MYTYKYIRWVKDTYRKYVPIQLPKSVIEHLQNNITQVIDIGAGGRPIKSLLPYAKNIDMYLCEPAPDSAQKLREKPQPWHSTTVIERAVADKNGTSKFYITKSASICSLLKPDAENLKNYQFYDRYGNSSNSDFDIVKEIEVQTNTLQSVIEEYKLKPYIIKVDTQGTELSILKAADLTNVQVILAEVNYINLYEGQNLADEFDEYLTSQGFTFHRMMEVFTSDVRKDGKRILIGSDVCYYRK